MHPLHSARTTRRSLLSATAWSVPAISVAAAAPAYADSGNVLQITATSASFVPAGTHLEFTGSLTVTNTGPTDVTDLTVEVALPLDYATLTLVVAPTTNAGWTPRLVPASGQSTFTATRTVSPAGSIHLSFAIGVAGTLPPDPLPAFTVVAVTGDFRTAAVAIQPTR